MKVAARTVHVHGQFHGHEHRVFNPGDKIPQWAVDLITNPAVFAESEQAAELLVEAAEERPLDDDQWETASYDGLKVDELKALLEERNLGSTGRKAELIQRLEDDDAAVG
jgi:hypothetical protein